MCETKETDMEVEKDENNFLKNVKQEHQNTKDEEEEIEILKKKISSHPLYGLLLEAHLDCLKVCSGNDAPEIDPENDANLNKDNLLPDSSIQTSTELDHFMEAYCLAVRELKEAMQKPMDETQRFIDAMYTQLRDIVHPGNSCCSLDSQGTFERFDVR